MAVFSSIYKKEFGKILYPLGFSISKSIFYKEVNENTCFIIHAKRVLYSRATGMIEVYIDVVPYCANLRSIEYDPLENANNILFYYKTIAPNLLDAEDLHDFLSNRFSANNDEDTACSIKNISFEIEELVLPYMMKFVDLEFYYNELQILCEINGSKNIYYDPFIHGMSIKLHEYKNALPLTEKRIGYHSGVCERVKLELEELKKGQYNKSIRRKIKQDNTFLDRFMNAKIEMIVDAEREIKILQTQKEALLANDQVFLDRLALDTENESRNYIRQVLMMGKN